MNDFKQNEKEHPDHIELRRLLQAAKPIVMPMFPDQRKKWVARSSLAQGLSAILVRHTLNTTTSFALSTTVFSLNSSHEQCKPAVSAD